MLAAVDYDHRQHRDYRLSRELGAENRALWSAVFARRAPACRPLKVLDLGCGTGRYTAMLAETFGAAIGVEPSDRMREEAMRATNDPSIRFLAGRAEAIPLPDGGVDLALMFLSFHHVRDRAAAAREIARVLTPQGRVFIRSVFSDRMPEIGWHAYFTGAREVELAMFPTVAEVEAAFAPVGLRALALDRIEERMAGSLAEDAARLRTRSISTFEHLPEAEIEQGFRRLDAAVAAETESQPVIGLSDLLVLERA